MVTGRAQRTVLDDQKRWDVTASVFHELSPLHIEDVIDQNCAIGSISNAREKNLRSS